MKGEGKRAMIRVWERGIQRNPKEPKWKQRKVDRCSWEEKQQRITEEP